MTSAPDSVLANLLDEGIALVVGILLGGYWNSRLARHTADRIRLAERQEEALLKLIPAVFDIQVQIASLSKQWKTSPEQMSFVREWGPIFRALVDLEGVWRRDLYARIRTEVVAKLAGGVWDRIRACDAHVVWTEGVPSPPHDLPRFFADVELLDANLTMLRAEAELRAQGKPFFKRSWWRVLRPS